MAALLSRLLKSRRGEPQDPRSHRLMGYARRLLAMFETTGRVEAHGVLVDTLTAPGTRGAGVDRGGSVEPGNCRPAVRRHKHSQVLRQQHLPPPRSRRAGRKRSQRRAPGISLSLDPASRRTRAHPHPAHQLKVDAARPLPSSAAANNSGGVRGVHQTFRPAEGGRLHGAGAGLGRRGCTIDQGIRTDVAPRGNGVVKHARPGDCHHVAGRHPRWTLQTRLGGRWACTASA